MTLPFDKIDKAMPQFRLHHVGYLVRDLSAAQEFVDRLGYRIESDVIEDPVQTAFVQLIRQPDTACWLELVMPNGSESKLAKALSKGGGLHHLCYEVNDIVRACDHLRGQAMLTLSNPVAAAAFPGRQIAWLMDRGALLIELLESGDGYLTLASIMKKNGVA